MQGAQHGSTGVRRRQAYLARAPIGGMTREIGPPLICSPSAVVGWRAGTIWGAHQSAFGIHLTFPRSGLVTPGDLNDTRLTSYHSNETFDCLGWSVSEVGSAPWPPRGSPKGRYAPS